MGLAGPVYYCSLRFTRLKTQVFVGKIRKLVIMLERIQSVETSLWFKLRLDSDEVKISSRTTVLWLRSLLVRILRFLL